MHAQHVCSNQRPRIRARRLRVREQPTLTSIVHVVRRESVSCRQPSPVCMLEDGGRQNALHTLLQLQRQCGMACASSSQSGQTLSRDLRAHAHVRTRTEGSKSLLGKVVPGIHANCHLQRLLSFLKEPGLDCCKALIVEMRGILLGLHTATPALKPRPPSGSSTALRPTQPLQSCHNLIRAYIP